MTTNNKITKEVKVVIFFNLLGLSDKKLTDGLDVAQPSSK